MKNFNDYLEMDGHLAFNLAIYNRFSSITDSAYADICGGFIEGVHQWATHNIDDVIESANQKYTGWTICFENGNEGKVYIENWVLNIEPKNWKHAKALFSKYLKVAPQYNLA
jgi:hypothetical protein